MKKSKIFKLCNRCDGTGYVMMIVGYNPDGTPIYEKQTCSNCKGEGNREWGFLKDKED